MKGKIRAIEDRFGSVVEYEKNKEAEAEKADASVVSSATVETIEVSCDWWEGCV